MSATTIIHDNWWHLLSTAMRLCPHLTPATGLTPAATENTVIRVSSKVLPAPFMIGTKLEPNRDGHLATGSFMKGVKAHLQKKAPELLHDTQYVSELFNEQSVAELYATNILHPVVNAMAVVLSDMLDYKVLKDAKYKFVIRPQQKQITDRGRSDHYISLEHFHDIPTSGQYLPDSTANWNSAEEFRNWVIQAKNGAQPKTYPRLIVCVIEEKRPKTLVYNRFISGYHSSSRAEDRNVYYILPQVKKYSADSHCPYVIVTDYLKSILLHFINLGVTLTSSNEYIQDPAKPEPEAAVEKDGIPPRLLLTLPIIKRLEDAGLLTVSESGIEFDALPSS